MLKKLDWIVIPGGPGMSSNYLEEALAKPFRESRLHYYCIHGAPDSIEKDPDIKAMVEQIFHTAQQANLSQFGLITHSFGNYLALRALEKKDNNIRAVIMLNPIPFTFKGWKNALANIINKVPEAILKKIECLAINPEHGGELFRMIYPYYTSDANAQLPMDISFDSQACNTISAKITDYDDRNLVNSITVPLIRISGDKDPFLDDKEILSDKTIILPNAGHYPFFETPVNFLMQLIPSSAVTF